MFYKCYFFFFLCLTVKQAIVCNSYNKSVEFISFLNFVIYYDKVFQLFSFLRTCSKQLGVSFIIIPLQRHQLDEIKQVC